MLVYWAKRLRDIALGVLVFGVVWEIATYLADLPEYLLPAPTRVMEELSKSWPRVLDHMWTTGLEIVLGFAISIAVSIPVALLVAYSRPIERVVYPAILFLQIVPKIAIAPLFIIWFGFGFTPKLLLVFLLSFFPIVVSSIAGFKSNDPDIRDLARSTGAGPFRAFFSVSLPQALPQIFTGLKVGAVFAATAAVVAEFIASDRGLGYLLLEYNGNLNTPMVFAVVVVLSLMGLVVYYVVEAAERLIIPWHVAKIERSQGSNNQNTTSLT